MFGEDISFWSVFLVNVFWGGRFISLRYEIPVTSRFDYTKFPFASDLLISVNCCWHKISVASTLGLQISITSRFKIPVWLPNISDMLFPIPFWLQNLLVPMTSRVHPIIFA